MRNPRSLLWLVLFAALAVSLAWAGDEKQAQKADAEKQESADKDDEVPLVITNEYLRKRFGGEEEEEPATPPPATPAPKTGDAAAKPGDKKPGDAKPGDAKPGNAEKKAEPKMSPAERAKRIAEIQSELQRLEKRTLALTNPYLAGTIPPTEEEREKERGMNNVERIAQHEKRIADLKKELAELQKSPN